MDRVGRMDGMWTRWTGWTRWQRALPKQGGPCWSKARAQAFGDPTLTLPASGEGTEKVDGVDGGRYGGSGEQWEWEYE